MSDGDGGAENPLFYILLCFGAGHEHYYNVFSRLVEEEFRSEKIQLYALVMLDNIVDQEQNPRVLLILLLL
jgi:hypothetical protein